MMTSRLSCRLSSRSDLPSLPSSNSWLVPATPMSLQGLAVTPAHMQVEKLRDEGVQLKMLQTGLALMQCPLLADNEVSSLPGLGDNTAVYWACPCLPLCLVRL